MRRLSLSRRVDTVWDGTRAAFPKAAGRAMARFEWDRGFYAETPIYSHYDRLPHDLAHDAVDAVLGPGTGSGNWRPFVTVLREHRDEMVEAERLPALLSAGGWPAAQQLLTLHWSDWPAIRARS